LAVAALKQLCGALADFVFPRICCGCGERIIEAERLVCAECEALIEPLRLPLCRVCGAEDAAVEPPCDDCPPRPIFFDAARATTEFHGVAKTVIERFKYSERMEYAPLMASRMASVFGREFPTLHVDIIVPVPLHAARQRERGYNQSWLLARALGEELAFEAEPNLLRRTRATPSQTRLNRRERASNMKDAFTVPGAGTVAGKTVLLVDDVYTTGSTLNECSRALSLDGAAAVYCIAFARATFR
jgi:competence protein ComFC